MYALEMKSDMLNDVLQSEELVGGLVNKMLAVFITIPMLIRFTRFTFLMLRCLEEQKGTVVSISHKKRV